MSLNGLPGVAPPSRVEATAPAPQNAVPVRNERLDAYTSPKSQSRGSGGLADALALTFKQLGLSDGAASSDGSGATDSSDSEAASQSRADLGRLMQALFQAVHAHSPPLATGASSFAAALASLTSQLSSSDSLGSVQSALNRVLQGLQSSQPANAKPAPTVQDLLGTLKSNLDAQTNVVHTKGNVLNARA